MAGALSILFPAVELPPLDDATYQVGVVDFFLSTDIQFTTQIADAQNVCPTEIDHVTIRVMYPSSGKLTKDGKPMTTKTSSPYLRPETAEAFCEETMKYGAPPPLQELPWMLHTWRLTQVDTIEHGKPLDGPFPLVIYSPGLGGSLEFYSYQTRSLASKGYIVVVVEHMDGSSAIVHRRDGTIVRRNESVLQVRTTTTHTHATHAPKKRKKSPSFLRQIDKFSCIIQIFIVSITIQCVLKFLFLCFTLCFRITLMGMLKSTVVHVEQ